MYPHQLQLPLSYNQSSKSLFIMKQTMTPCSAFLLILLLVHLFLHSTFSMRKLEDAEIEKSRALEIDRQDKLFVEDDHVRRIRLHEVGTGPNPVSNSLPKAKWKINLERYT